MFIGDDRAEEHHDIAVRDEAGHLLARRRVNEGVAGLESLHALVADHLEDHAGPGDVAVDRDLHRRVAADSDAAEGTKVLARAHQSLIWARQRQVNVLRSNLREYYPAALAAFGTELHDRDAVAVLAAAPGPAAGARLTDGQVQTLLKRAGRQRNTAARAGQITAALRSGQLPARPGIEAAHTATTAAPVAVIAELNTQVQALREQVEASFARHPDAEVYPGQPGLGPVLAARVLAEFGDAPGRNADAKSRRNYAGTSPVTRASGTRRVVLARHARNRRLADRAGRPGVQRDRRLARGQGLLRRAPGPRREPPPGPAGRREPARRRPPRMPPAPYGPRRGHGLARAH